MKEFVLEAALFCKKAQCEAQMSVEKKQKLALYVIMLVAVCVCVKVCVWPYVCVCVNVCVWRMYACVCILFIGDGASTVNRATCSQIMETDICDIATPPRGGGSVVHAMTGAIEQKVPVRFSSEDFFLLLSFLLFPSPFSLLLSFFSPPFLPIPSFSLCHFNVRAFS